MQSLPTKNIQTNPRKLRTIRREAEWQALLSEYAASNLSQKAFCDSHQLSMSSFYQWNKRLSSDAPKETNFIDISHQVRGNSSFEQEKPEQTPVYQIELELGFGIVLRVRSV